MNDKQNSVQNIFCRRFLAGLSTKYGVSVYMKCIHLEPLLQYRRSSATYFVVLIRLFKRIPLQSVQTEHYCAFPHPLSFKTRKLFFDFSKLHRFCPWYIVLKRPLTNQPINQPRLVLPGLLAKRPLHWTRQTWGLKHEKKKNQSQACRGTSQFVTVYRPSLVRQILTQAHASIGFLVERPERTVRVCPFGLL